MKTIFTLFVVWLCGPLFIHSSQAQDGERWIDHMVNYSVEDYVVPSKFKWDWSQATLMKSLVLYHESGIESSSRDSMLEYFDTCLEKTKDTESGIHPNVVSMGHVLAYMARITGSEDYRQRAFALYDQYIKVIRAKNGGISHRDYTVELWDDTVYMIGLYLFEMHRLTGDQKYLSEFVLQLEAHHEKLMDKVNGLWVHAWDEDGVYEYDRCGMENWSENEAHRNSEHWGRGNGWVVMACADALELLKPDTKEYESVKAIFMQLVERLSELQDAETGHWYQLPIYPGEEGNWIESSCTAMFAYGIAKGINLGVLKPKKYRLIADKAYEGLTLLSMKTIDDRWTTPTNVCTGTCPGDKEYYYNRKVVEGKPFALGSFIMMGLEFKSLNRKQR